MDAYSMLALLGFMGACFLAALTGAMFRPSGWYEQLAKSSPITKYPTERLRLLNDLYPDKEPVAGQKLKVVQ